MTVIELRDRVPTIHKERNARKHDGQNVAWILTDKYGQMLVCAQKIARIQSFVNEHALSKHDRVHLSGLYESLASNGRITGGYYKNRWKLQCCPVEEAVKVLEKQRVGVEKALLLTD